MKQLSQIHNKLNAFIDISLVEEIVPFGNGHINDTFRVKLCTGEILLLQHMGHFVFPDIPSVMNNLLTVTQYLQNEGERTLRSRKTFGQSYYYRTDSGDYWRLFDFEMNSICFEYTKSPNVAKEFGKVLASFHCKMAGLPPNALKETYPQFNDLSYHLYLLEEAVCADRFDRLKDVVDKVAYVRLLQDKMLLFYRQDFPKRLIHNDAKLNNVLFDLSGNALFMIDLDTVMLGFVHYDFGDMVRTVCSGVSDDEKNLNKVEFLPYMYEACKDGYISVSEGFISDDELLWLDKSAEIMTYMMGVKFLIDYLNGDRYYKTKYKKQNYDRLCCQFKFLQELIDYFGE